VIAGNARIGLLLTLVAGLARAEEPAILTWEDAEGTVHYSNEKGRAPAGARATTGEPLTVIQGSTKAPGVRGKASVAPASEGTAEAARRREEAEARRAEAEASRAVAELEASWRNQFREARDRISEVTQELERQRAKVEDPSGLPISGRFVSGVTCSGACGHVTYLPDADFQQTKLKVRQLEQQLAQAQSELQDLERRASNAAVPLEWRR
jgi:hypothetical protein